MWDLSSLSRDQPMPPALEAQSLNHWTTREVTIFTISIFASKLILYLLLVLNSYCHLSLSSHN